MTIMNSILALVAQQGANADVDKLAVNGTLKMVPTTLWDVLIALCICGAVIACLLIVCRAFKFYLRNKYDAAQRELQVNSELEELKMTMNVFQKGIHDAVLDYLRENKDFCKKVTEMGYSEIKESAAKKRSDGKDEQKMSTE